jgi:Golgi nucleoside diphosphatase
LYWYNYVLCVHTTVYVYLLVFIKLSLSKNKCYKIISQLVETLKGNNITQEGIYSLYKYIADNFKEYDLDTEYCINIYKYFVCESRDMSDGSGAYILFF